MKNQTEYKNELNFIAEVGETIYDVTAIDIAGGVFTCYERNNEDAEETELHRSQIDNLWAIVIDEDGKAHKLGNINFYMDVDNDIYYRLQKEAG